MLQHASKPISWVPPSFGLSAPCLGLNSQSFIKTPQTCDLVFPEHAESYHTTPDPPTQINPSGSAEKGQVYETRPNRGKWLVDPLPFIVCRLAGLPKVLVS